MRMDRADRTASRLQWRSLAAFAPAAALFVWLCVQDLFTRTNPDEAAYKIIDVGIVHGYWPYRDLFINRQPLTFLWYLPMGLGASIYAERVLAAAMMGASVLVVMRLASRWFSPERALPAGIAYALLLANPLMPVVANTEAFILLPLTAAFLVTSPFFAGALLAVAVMTKLHAAVFAPVLLVLWWRRLPPVAIGGAIVVAICVLPFVPIWHDFWVANVTFTLDYGHYTSANRLEALRSVHRSLVYALLPLWVAALIGAVRSRNAALLVWAVCGVAAVKASGNDYDHYYALLAPPVALLGVEGIAYMYRRPVLGAVLAATCAWAVLIFGAAAIARFRVTPNGPYEVLGHATAAKPGEVYVLGSRSDVYTYADRQPRRRFFFSIPYVIRPHWAEEAGADLLSCPPDVLVVLSNDGDWPIPFRDDVTALYARSEQYEAGTVYTEPAPACVR
jgi:hypothetical protein